MSRRTGGWEAETRRLQKAGDKRARLAARVSTLSHNATAQMVVQSGTVAVSVTAPQLELLAFVLLCADSTERPTIRLWKCVWADNCDCWRSRCHMAPMRDFPPHDRMTQNSHLKWR